MLLKKYAIRRLPAGHLVLQWVEITSQKVSGGWRWFCINETWTG